MANLRFFCDLLWFLIQFFRSPSVSLNLGRIDTLVFFFDLTLTILLLLGSRGDSLVSDSGARGVNLVHLRAELFIAANESDHAAEGANARALRVPLKLVAHTLGQNRHRDLILVVVFELSSNVADLSDHDASVVHVADHDSADSVTDVEDVRDAVGHNELVRHFLLRAHDNAVGAADGN